MKEKRSIIIGVVLICLIVGFYYWLLDGEKSYKENAEKMKLKYEKISNLVSLDKLENAVKGSTLLLKSDLDADKFKELYENNQQMVNDFLANNGVIVAVNTDYFYGLDDVFKTKITESLVADCNSLKTVASLYYKSGKEDKVLRIVMNKSGDLTNDILNQNLKWIADNSAEKVIDEKTGKKLTEQWYRIYSKNPSNVLISYNLYEINEKTGHRYYVLKANIHATTVERKFSKFDFKMGTISSNGICENVAPRMMTKDFEYHADLSDDKNKQSGLVYAGTIENAELDGCTAGAGMGEWNLKFFRNKTDDNFDFLPAVKFSLPSKRKKIKILTSFDLELKKGIVSKDKIKFCRKLYYSK